MAVTAPVIDGKYTLLRRLGAGGMAEVFLAKQASHGNVEKLVVIKRILPQLVQGSGTNDFVRMFLDEARLAGDLRHPNIVTVMDVGKTGGTYYIVMEFLHGQDVRKMQRKNAAWGEQIPLGHCCRIAVDAAVGLHYAHTKKDLEGRPLSIVHRDVSPQNILLTYEGATKIVDFGIAKAATQTTHTSVGVLKGKYTYMSPEQAAGQLVDARTDQFALGIVFWELLTMRRLFKRDSEMATIEAIMSGSAPRPSRFRADVPKAIDDLVMKMLARDKNDRFADLQQMAMALEDIVAREGIVSSQSRLSQYMRRLFADSLAEEATLGLVNPDGSLTKNLTPFTLPPQGRGADDVVEKASDKPAVTLAARKSARSTEEPPAPPPKPTPISRSITGSNATDPTVVRDPRPRRTVTRRPAIARSRIAIAAAGFGAAAVVLLAWLFWSWWLGHGPADLIVRSDPTGASVSLDGQPTGQTTPALLRGVEAGRPHKVRLELAGGRVVEEVVVIDRRGDTATVRLQIP